MNVVARIGKPHGIRGEVTVEVLTDSPEERFVPGAEFATEPGGGVLTLTGARWHNSRLLLSFAEVETRNRAEELRETRLLADVSDDEAADDDDAWYIDDLVDLSVRLAGDDGEPGREVGRVVRLERGAVQDLLVIRMDAGHEALVPFVEQIVPEVDVDGGYVLLTPPGGLLDPPGKGA